MFSFFLLSVWTHAVPFSFIYKITMITVIIVIENKCYSNDDLGDKHLASIYTMSLTFSPGVTSNHTILM